MQYFLLAGWMKRINRTARLASLYFYWQETNVMDWDRKNKYKTDSLYRFLLPEVFFRVFLRFYLILFYIPALRIYLVSPCQILDDCFIKHFRIYLCCLDRCMPQKFLDGGYRNALVNQESGTSVSAGMVGKLLADMHHSSQFLQCSVGVRIAT